MVRKNRGTECPKVFDEFDLMSEAQKKKLNEIWKECKPKFNYKIKGTILYGTSDGLTKEDYEQVMKPFDDRKK